MAVHPDLFELIALGIGEQPTCLAIISKYSTMGWSLDSKTYESDLQMHGLPDSKEIEAVLQMPADPAFHQAGPGLFYSSF